MLNNGGAKQCLKVGQKKNHKYIRKEGNRYIYPEDIHRQTRNYGQRTALKYARDNYSGLNIDDGATYPKSASTVVSKKPYQTTSDNIIFDNRGHMMAFNDDDYLNSRPTVVSSYGNRPSADYGVTRTSRHNNRFAAKNEEQHNRDLQNLQKARNAGMPQSDYNKAKRRSLLQAIRERVKSSKVQNRNAKEYANIVQGYVKEIAKQLGNR